MSVYVNKGFYAGKVMGDPETRTLNNGGKVTSFQLGVSKRFRNKTTGEVSWKNNYLKIQAWNRGNNKLADVVAEHVKAGNNLLVQAEVEQQNWTDNDGKKRSTYVFNMDTFNFLDIQKKEEGEPATSEESDIPF